MTVLCVPSVLTLVRGQVQLDGSGSDSPNVDGLPSSLTVSLMGDATTVLSKAQCAGCMVARLVKCDDSTPTAGTSSGESSSSSSLL